MTVQISDDLLSWFNEVQQPDALALLGQQDLAGGALLEKVTLRSTAPLAEPISLDQEFFRARVQLAP